MIILPGAGEHVHDVFEKDRQSTSYTYRGKSSWGSVNTGLILYRRTAAMFEWLSAVSTVTSELVFERNETFSRAGAQNQLAIDKLGAENVPFGESYAHAPTGAKIFSISRDLLNGPGNCCGPRRSAVLHFNADTKPNILHSCCTSYWRTHCCKTERSRRGSDHALAKLSDTSSISFSAALLSPHSRWRAFTVFPDNLEAVTTRSLVSAKNWGFILWSHPKVTKVAQRSRSQCHTSVAGRGSP